MTDVLISILALVVTLGVLISFHEFGHFWVARRCGVKVLRFSIGFGKPIWLRRGKTDETEYVITALPLGGYVKMLDEREGEVPAAERHRAFNRQSVWARIAIVSAGPLFNFLFAILAYYLMFMVGVNGVKPLFDDPTPGSMAAAAGFEQGDQIVAIGDTPTATLDEVLLALIEYSMDDEAVDLQVRTANGSIQRRSLDLQNTGEYAESRQLLQHIGLSLWQPQFPAVIERLKSGGAGEQAGLQGGDKIIQADDTDITHWQQWADYVRERPGVPIDILVERDGRIINLSLTPETIASGGGEIGLIGAYARVPQDLAAEMRVTVRYGPWDAFTEAAAKTLEMSLFTLRMLARMLIGQASLENISGPITIAQFAGQSASIGWVPFLSFLALVSISLGVLNLLPVPVLDGGHLLYYAIELITGRPLSEASQYVGQRIGIVLLLMLMSLAIFNDVARLIG